MFRHEIRVDPAFKPDSPHMFESICSCGSYRSGPYGSPQGARRAGQQHADHHNSIEPVAPR